MRAAGIDIGSRTIKVVLLEDGEFVFGDVADNSFNPLEVCRELLRNVPYDSIVATGYGRHLFAQCYSCPVVTEIKAVAAGARRLLPGTRTVLDIGGQDLKAVSVDARGRAGKFEMNDRCAAGTGRFLEVMAAALSLTMEDFVAAARRATQARKISSMCTVFAESEVVSMAAGGVPRGELALGIHEAIAGRAAAMLRRIPVDRDIVFCGGAGLNSCLHDAIERALGEPVLVAPGPQLVSALGCAWLASG